MNYLVISYVYGISEKTNTGTLHPTSLRYSINSSVGLISKGTSPFYPPYYSTTILNLSYEEDVINDGLSWNNDTRNVFN